MLSGVSLGKLSLAQAPTFHRLAVASYHTSCGSRFPLKSITNWGKKKKREAKSFCKWQKKKLNKLKQICGNGEGGPCIHKACQWTTQLAKIRSWHNRGWWLTPCLYRRRSMSSMLAAASVLSVSTKDAFRHSRSCMWVGRVLAALRTQRTITIVTRAKQKKIHLMHKNTLRVAFSCTD